MNGTRVLQERLIWSARTIPDDTPVVVCASAAAGSPFVGSSNGLSR